MAASRPYPEPSPRPSTPAVTQSHHCPLSLPVALRPPVLHWGLRTALLGMLLVLASGSRRCAPCLRCPPTLCTVFPPVPFSLLDVLNSGNCVRPRILPFAFIFFPPHWPTLRRRPAPASGGRVVLRTRVLRAPSKPLLHSPHTVVCCVPNYVPPPFFSVLHPPSFSLPLMASHGLRRQRFSPPAAIFIAAYVQPELPPHPFHIWTAPPIVMIGRAPPRFSARPALPPPPPV
jgi:hypothetical protein